MKPIFLLCLLLVLGGGLCGCSSGSIPARASADSASISPHAEEILRQTAVFYQNLSSFEGTNTISETFPSRYSRKATRQNVFAFARPDKFFIRSPNTNDEQLFCDGTHLWNYRPYYFNSYTVTPAPARFEEAVTNWIGGELLYVMVNTNRYHYLTNGMGSGLVALKYIGLETVTGVKCHHLLMEESGSKTAEFWVAKGRSPYILKYVFRYPMNKPAGSVRVHTEIISGWKANSPISLQRFTFVPPAGAIARASGDDDVELSTRIVNGVKHDDVRFFPHEEPDQIKENLKRDAERLQAVALQSIGAKYPDLKTNDLVFVDIQMPFGSADEKTLVMTFGLPKTMATTNANLSIVTSEQIVTVTLSSDGEVKSISRGISNSSRPSEEKK